MTAILSLITFSTYGTESVKNYEAIDLTHEVHSEIPTWDLTCGYFVKTMRDYHDCEGQFKFRSQVLDIRASAGTHIDSPAHCFEGAPDVSDLPLERLITSCVVIDVSKQATEHYKVSVTDIEVFESKYGTIQPNTCVLFYTGWSRFWDEPKKYHNKLVFPSISAEAAELLLQRQIVGIGIDTLSPDCDERGSFVHHIILGANKFIVENIANLDRMPPAGAVLLIMPLNLVGAAESPVRLVGIVEK